MNDHLLATYLNNHLAGSVAGIELTRRCHATSRGNQLGDFLGKLLLELDQERGLLKQLLDQLGVQEQSVKKLGAWVFEKLGEVAIGDYSRKHPTLAKIFELEGILLGSTARLELWRLLETCRSADGRLNNIDFSYFKERAEFHCRELERFHQMAAKDLFSLP